MNKFIKAMEILERDGWCRFMMKNHRGEHCMLGAVGVAEGYEDESYELCRMDVYDSSEAAFNDTSTYEDVLTYLAFRAAGAP